MMSLSRTIISLSESMIEARYDRDKKLVTLPVKDAAEAKKRVIDFAAYLEETHKDWFYSVDDGVYDDGMTYEITIFRKGVAVFDIYYDSAQKLLIRYDTIK